MLSKEDVSLLSIVRENEDGTSTLNFRNFKERVEGFMKDILLFEEEVCLFEKEVAKSKLVFFKEKKIRKKKEKLKEQLVKLEGLCDIARSTKEIRNEGVKDFLGYVEMFSRTINDSMGGRL